MAEGVYAVAVDVRHGPGRAHLEVAGDERYADRVSFAQGTGGGLGFVEAAPVMIGVKPESRNAPATTSAISGSKPPMSSGVEIGRIIAPSCAPAAAGMPIV